MTRPNDSVMGVLGNYGQSSEYCDLVRGAHRLSLSRSAAWSTPNGSSQSKAGAGCLPTVTSCPRTQRLSEAAPRDRLVPPPRPAGGASHLEHQVEPHSSQVSCSLNRAILLKEHSAV